MSKCYMEVRESKEMLTTLKCMLHHVYLCMRVQEMPPSQVTSLLHATTSQREAIRSIEVKSASSWPKEGADLYIQGSFHPSKATQFTSEISEGK